MNFLRRAQPTQVEMQGIPPQMRPNRDRGSAAVNLLVAGAVVVGGLTVLAVVADDILEGINVDADLGNIDPTDVDPVQTDIAVDQTSPRQVARMKISCLMLASAGIDIDSTVDGWLFSEASWRTKLYFDFQLCGESEAVLVNRMLDMVEGQEGVDIVNYQPKTGEFEVDIFETHDPKTGRVTEATVTLPSLQLFRPRPKPSDMRNCLSGTYENSTDEIDAKLAERQAKIDNGESPECDNNFSITGLVGSKGSRAITFGYSAAQLGMLYDLKPAGLLVEANTDYGQIVYETMIRHDRYKDAIVTIKFDDNTDSYIKTVIEAERQDAIEDFESVKETIDDEGRTVLEVKGHGGDAAKMILSSEDIVIDYKDLIIGDPVIIGAPIPTIPTPVEVAD